jgi:hypothetical protein
MDEEATAQEAIKPTETPVFDSKDAPLQLENIRVELDKSMKKPEPPQPKGEEAKLFHFNLYIYLSIYLFINIFIYLFIYLFIN